MNKPGRLKNHLLRSLLAGMVSFSMVCAVALPGTAAAASAPPAVNVQAKAALLVDLASGDVLYSKNPDTPYAPASLTKVMTLFLAYQALHSGKIKPDSKVPIHEDAWAQNPVFVGASLMFLKPGDDVTVMQVLQGMAIPSGNDAAVAMADFLAGSVPKFVDEMNAEAKQLGMTHTHYVDPNGLSPQNQSTASDLMKLAEAYIRNYPEALQQVDSVPEFTYAGITQKNTNRLIGTYQGADGVKTGYLPEVGYNQISSAKRGDMRLISIVMGTESSEARREQSAGLLDFGFNNYASTRVAAATAAQGSVRVWKGQENEVTAVPAADVWAAVPKGASARPVLSASLTGNVTAPVAAGQKLGTLTISLDGKVIRSVDLVAKTAVPEGGIFKRLWDDLVLLIEGMVQKQHPAGK